MEDAVTENLNALVEYEREDACEVLVPESNIFTTLLNGRLNSRASFALCWRVPTVGDGRGNILTLSHFVVSFANEGCYNIISQSMQPHGFENSPSSVAGWTSLSKESDLPPGGKRSYRIVPVANNFVVPSRIDIKGLDYIHVASVSVSRQPLTPAGSAPDKLTNEIGIRFKMRAVYSSAGNKVEESKAFVVRMFKTDAHMSLVNSAPPLSFDIGSLVSSSGKAVKRMEPYCESGSAGYGPVRYIVRYADGSASHEPGGLTPGVVYELPVAVLAAWKQVQGTGGPKPTPDSSWRMASGRFICHSYGGTVVADYASHTWILPAGWYLCSAPKTAVDFKAGTDGFDFWKHGVLMALNEYSSATGGIGSATMVRLYPGDRLVPSPGVVNWNITTKTLKKPRLMAKVKRVSHLVNIQVEEDWVDRLVAGVTFVVRVIKTAALVASAVGLMDCEEISAGSGRHQGLTGDFSIVGQ